MASGLIDRELGSALGTVEDLRLLADYTAEDIPADKAMWAVGQAEKFVQAVRGLLGATGTPQT